MPDSEFNAFSDIDLKHWRDYNDVITGSLWLLGSRDKSGPHVGDYWGNFVPQIPNQVLRRFTRQGEVVLDLFSGMGTTLIECRHLGRHGIGVELHPEVATRSQERIAQASNPFDITTSVIVGDSASPAIRERLRAEVRSILVGADGQVLATARRSRRIAANAVRPGAERGNLRPPDDATDRHRSLTFPQDYLYVHCVILHPPYHDIIKFGDDPRDLSNAPTLPDFLHGFRSVVANAIDLLAPGRHLALVIGDKYVKPEIVPLGFECMNICRELGLQLKAINVKDIQGNQRGKGKSENLWKYRVLKQGLYIFKHEYIMIFRKQ